MQARESGDRRYILGIILVFIGVILLLGSIDILDIRLTHIIFSWPFIFLVLGLFILLNTEKKLLGGLFAGIGFFFLIPRIFPEVHYHGGIVFAVLFIGLGIYVLFNRRTSLTQGTGKHSQIKKDVIDDVSIFGGGSKLFTSDNFKGGNITAIFGGSEINLTGCRLAEGENILDILLVFGGTTIIIPKDWNVVVNVTSVLGGFSDKSIRDPNVIPDQTRTLYIKGLALFGGGEIKNYV